MAGATKAVTEETFATDVLASTKPVLVDFWAEWCTPCKLVAPVLEEIASEHADKIDVVKLNIDENPRIAGQYQIMSIPTMAVFVDGQLAKSIVGAKPKSAIVKELSSFL
jgi:thioredoxin 1